MNGIGFGRDGDMASIDRLLQRAVADGADGNHAEASLLIRTALATAPDLDVAWANLAVAQRSLGSLERSVASGHRAVAIAWNSPRLWSLLGSLGVEARLPSAGRACRRAILLEPMNADAWGNLGLHNRQAGNRQQFLDSSSRAIALDPLAAPGWNNLGLALVLEGRYAHARGAFATAIQLDGTLASAHANLGHIMLAGGQVADGLACYRRAIVHEPTHADALNGLAGGLKDQSQAGLAVHLAQRAMVSDPENLAAARTYLTCLLHLPGLSPSALFDAHRRTMATFERRISPLPPAPISPAPKRRLAVGYVSSDFRRHPNTRFLKQAFRYRNRDEIDAVVYSDTFIEDEDTAWYRENVGNWRDVRGKSDAQVAEMVRRDSIDVLVILAGHFDDNRPMLAAYAPAPLQVSLFDGATSGVSRMTHWITDAALHPDDTLERFTETLVRLPCFYSFEPPPSDPPISEPPILSHGYPTFGSFINPARITPDVIKAWARILTRVPEARLVLKNRTAFATQEIQRRFMSLFADLGIDIRRIRLIASDDNRVDHQARYNDLDISLDTFPFTGASTSFDALWMGVPVVTLSGWSFVQRITESLLRPLGLGELVTRTVDDYVETAVTLSRRLDFLSEFRREARSRITASRLCDGVAYAASLESAYKTLWRELCSRSAG